MRVISFTADDISPSSRFRIRQYRQLLENSGIELVDIDRGKSGLLRKIKHRIARNTIKLQAMNKISNLLLMLNKNVSQIQSDDVLWLAKDGFPICLMGLKNKKVLEVDDAVWMHTPQIKEIAKQVDAINVGNSFLADWASNYCDKVFITPTCIDTERYSTLPESTCDKFIIGWTGLATNLKYLRIAEVGIGKLLRQYKDIEVRLLCNEKPVLPWIPEENFRYFKWSKSSEVQFLRDLSVGIMPLFNTAWEKGKCSFKMIQYMALSKPVVVSPVGMNIDVMQHDDVGFFAENDAEWYEKLEYFYLNRNEVQKKGQNAGKVVEEFYSIQANVNKLVNVFNQLAR